MRPPTRTEFGSRASQSLAAAQTTTSVSPATPSWDFSRVKKRDCGRWWNRSVLWPSQRLHRLSRHQLHHSQKFRRAHRPQPPHRALRSRPARRPSPIRAPSPRATSPQRARPDRRELAPSHQGRVSDKRQPPTTSPPEAPRRRGDDREPSPPPDRPPPRGLQPVTPRAPSTRALSSRPRRHQSTPEDPG